MPISQNGWTAVESATDPRLTALSWITGKVRAGDVHALFDHVARRFHTEVEPVTRAHSWGWAYRKVTGGTSLSNHASGTAIDLNAPAHPLGATGTFSAAQAATIRAIVAQVDAAGGGPVLRWGGDYAGRKDEMHLEVVGSAARVARAVAALAGPATGSNGTTGTTNADGSLALAEDGMRGRATIGRWQEVLGTPVDWVLSRPSTVVAADQRFLGTVVGAGHLVDLTGSADLAADGYEGPATVRARQFHLFNAYGPAVLGRAPTAADFDGVAGTQTTRLHQHALNRASARSGRY